MNIQQAVENTLEQALGERSLHTRRTYQNAINNFVTYLFERDGIKPTDDISLVTAEHFIHFPGWLATRFEKRTTRVYMAGVRYLMDWMVVQNLLMPDYAQTVRLQKAMQQATKKMGEPATRTPAKGHLERMLDAVRQMDEPSPRKERDLALVLFLATSGCRNSEAASMKIGHLDMSERQAQITGKGEKPRMAFFTQDAADALRAYWVARGGVKAGDYVFVRHDKGKPKDGWKQHLTPASVRNIVNEVARVAGITGESKFTPHYFRHAFAISALRDTGNLALVQDLLGHKSADTTRIYAEIYPDELRDAHRAIFDKKKQ